MAYGLKACSCHPLNLWSQLFLSTYGLMAVYQMATVHVDFLQILTSVPQTHVSTMGPVLIGLRDIFAHASEDLKEVIAK